MLQFCIYRLDFRVVHSFRLIEGEHWYVCENRWRELQGAEFLKGSMTMFDNLNTDPIKLLLKGPVFRYLFFTPDSSGASHMDTLPPKTL